MSREFDDTSERRQSKFSQVNEWIRHIEQLQWAVLSVFFSVTLVVLKSFYFGESSFINEYPNLSGAFSLSFIILWGGLIVSIVLMDNNAQSLLKKLEDDDMNKYPSTDFIKHYDFTLYTPLGIVGGILSLIFILIFSYISCTSFF